MKFARENSKFFTIPDPVQDGLLRQYHQVCHFPLQFHRFLGLRGPHWHGRLHPSANEPIFGLSRRHLPQHFGHFDHHWRCHAPHLILWMLWRLY